MRAETPMHIQPLPLLVPVYARKERGTKYNILLIRPFFEYYVTQSNMRCSRVQVESSLLMLLFETPGTENAIFGQQNHSMQISNAWRLLLKSQSAGRSRPILK